MDIEQRVYENEDGIMSKAQTKDEYITAWNYHIDELTSLGWPPSALITGKPRLTVSKKATSMSLQSKLQKLASMRASYRFRLGAILACDNRPGQFWA